MGNLLRMITQYTEARDELQRLGSLSARHLRGGENATDGSLLWPRVKTRLTQIREQGDQALLPQTPRSVKVSGSDLDAAYQQISQGILKGIRVTCQQLQHFHRYHLPKNWVKFTEEEQVFAQRFYPARRVGFYVSARDPLALQLRNLLHQAIAAQVAQVPQRVLVTPGDNQGKIPPALLVAAQEAGIEEIYRLEGATAIAVLAYGTESIPPVEVITGVGEEEVTLAKQWLQGWVKTDEPVDQVSFMLLADHQANPHHLALELLSQAEQDPTAALILLTTDPHLAQTVQNLLPRYLQSSPQAIQVEKAIAHYGLGIIVEDEAEALTLVNDFHPYYLRVDLAQPWDFVEKVRRGKTILIGSATPRLVQDYLGGNALLLSHTTLARSAASVNLYTYLHTSTLLEYSPQALKQYAFPLEPLLADDGPNATLQNLQTRLYPQSFGDLSDP